jgi:tRNA nucleotidyltransferase (CCA-adding enzyme)
MTYVDSIFEEVERMTPKTGYNVCMFDDFGDVGEKLTLIGHFKSKEEADDLVAEYDDDITLYIYGEDVAEEKQLDLSQRKGHNIDRYIDKAEREYLKGENPDNDEFEKLNSQSYKEGESFKEEDHPRGQPDNAGQFATKDGDQSTYTSELKKKVEPNSKMKTLQSEVDEEITDKIWSAIDEMGIRDKIKTVEMQGSFAKGTDLPVFEGDSKGSDLDLFLVFKSDVPEEERNNLGFEIGMKALDGKDPYEQNATSRYAEAIFEHKGEKMEVQIVPTRHLTREQIENKEYDGKEITIGMERTPHQTKFMKDNLTPEMQEQTRMLKSFMKDAKLYDSSMKSQGFSGYSTESLIYNLGSFDAVVDYFADFKEGDILNKSDRDDNLGKGNKDNLFSLYDPIDKNRDLISAFSPVKIGRTIETMRYFKEHGKIPSEISTVEKDSVTVKYSNSVTNEDILAGQARKSEKGIIKQLNKMGFKVEIKEEVVDGLKDPIQVTRSKMDQNKDSNEVSLTFGVDSYNIDEESRTELGPKANLDEIRKGGARVEIENGIPVKYAKRPYTNIADALKFLTTDNVDKTGMSKGTIKDMKNGVNISKKPNDKFENML